MILEPRSKAEAMITCGIDMHRTLVARITHRLIVLQSVGYERYQTVITGRDNNSRRCEMTTHGILRRELAHQLWILLSLLTQEVEA